MLGRTGHHVPAHEAELDDRERAVQEEEDGQAQEQERGRHLGDSLLSRQQSVHDPRLTGILGEDPAEQIAQPRGEDDPDGNAPEQLARRHVI